MGAAPVVIDEVSYSYRTAVSERRVLNQVSMSIESSEMVILTGPSGSGKTTLITLIGALRAAQEGSVQVLGHELRGASERDLTTVRRHIGYIFQQHNLLDSMTIAQNVLLSLQLGEERLSRKQQRARVVEVLQQVGLGEHVNKHPSALSGGQKQRAGIARALVTRPRLILADEPTASLDKDSGRTVVNLIQQLCKEQGASVVLVTHDNRILDVADRILHLEDGEIQSISEAVSSSTSRMLRLLDKYDPASSHYLSAFALALTRVAMADNRVDAEEREAIRSVLNDASGLAAAEVDLVMELALAQVRCQAGFADGSHQFSAEQGRFLVESLQRVAAADGEISDDECAEIELIARELGFPGLAPAGAWRYSSS